MIEIVNCYARIDLGSNNFVKVLKGMNEAGYKSAIWQSKLTLLSSVGIIKLDKETLDWFGYYNINGRESFVYRANIFIDNSDSLIRLEQYYIIQRNFYVYSKGRRIFLRPFSSRVISGMDRTRLPIPSILYVMMQKIL